MKEDFELAMKLAKARQEGFLSGLICGILFLLSAGYGVFLAVSWLR